MVKSRLSLAVLFIAFFVVAPAVAQSGPSDEDAVRHRLTILCDVDGAHVRFNGVPVGRIEQGRLERRVDSGTTLRISVAAYGYREFTAVVDVDEAIDLRADLQRVTGAAGSSTEAAIGRYRYGYDWGYTEADLRWGGLGSTEDPEQDARLERTFGFLTLSGEYLAQLSESLGVGGGVMIAYPGRSREAIVDPTTEGNERDYGDPRWGADLSTGLTAKVVIGPRITGFAGTLGMCVVVDIFHWLAVNIGPTFGAWYRGFFLDITPFLFRISDSDYVPLEDESTLNKNNGIWIRAGYSIYKGQ